MVSDVEIVRWQGGNEDVQDTCLSESTCQHSMSPGASQAPSNTLPFQLQHPSQLFQATKSAMTDLMAAQALLQEDPTAVPETVAMPWAWLGGLLPPSVGARSFLWWRTLRRPLLAAAAPAWLR